VLVGQWIGIPWIAGLPESIVKGFERYCLSNNMNGTEDDIFWEEDNAVDCGIS
jgi:hypothetical protein